MEMILVAGLWLRASVWDRTASKLTRLGHTPRPVRLPGVDRIDGAVSSSAGLEAQLATVLTAIDAAEQPMVIGHSAAAGLAWMAADRRADRIAGVAMIGGFPPTDGQSYIDGFDTDAKGEIPFPGWEEFVGPDSDDLNEQAKAALANGAVPVTSEVARASVQLQNPLRADVATAIICPEFAPEDVQQWLIGGQLPELGRITNVTLIDIASGHWPMVSAPGELAAALDRFAAELDR